MPNEEKLRSEIDRLFQEGLTLEKTARLSRNYRLQKDVAERFGAAATLLDELLSGTGPDQPVFAIDRALREYYDSQRHKALSTFYYEDRDLDNADTENAQSSLSVERALALIPIALAYATDDEAKTWLDARSRTWGLMLKNNKAQGAAIKARRYWESRDYQRASDYHEQTARYAEEAVTYAETNDVKPEFARVLRTTALVMRANSLQAASTIFFERAVEDLDLEDAIRGIRTMLDALRAFEEALLANPEWT